jgi:hypothetical protein
MRRSSFLKVGILLATLATTATHQVGAESGIITIKQGTFIFEEGVGHLDIAGNHRFRFVAAADISGGRFNAYTQCQSWECPPGAVVNLDARWTGNDLPGSAQLRGKTYENVGGLDSDSAADVGFAGSVTMPPMSGEPTAITAAFDLSGAFAYDLLGANPQRDLLAGGGRVTLSLRPNADGSSWEIQRAVFEFIPVEQR